MWFDADDTYFREPPIEATWEEFNSFHKEIFRSLTFSEFDQEEKASIFYIEQDVPSYGAFLGDFVPLNFISSHFLHTHKGNSLIYCSRNIFPTLIMQEFHPTQES